MDGLELHYKAPGQELIRLGKEISPQNTDPNNWRSEIDFITGISSLKTTTTNSNKQRVRFT